MSPDLLRELADGMKFDGEKPDWSLMPHGALRPVVEVLTQGARKYERFDWEKTIQEPLGRARYYAAALRHLDAYHDGEVIDEESGLPHLAHAVCSLLFLLSDHARTDDQ